MSGATKAYLHLRQSSKDKPIGLHYSLLANALAEDLKQLASHVQYEAPPSTCGTKTSVQPTAISSAFRDDLTYVIVALFACYRVVAVAVDTVVTCNVCLHHTSVLHGRRAANPRRSESSQHHRHCSPS